MGFCGCARPCPIENSSLLEGAGIGNKRLRLPGRGGAYCRLLISIGRLPEVLCYCRKWGGEGCDGGCGSNREGKCPRPYPGVFVGEGSRGRQGREVEEMPGCPAREEYTLGPESAVRVWRGLSGPSGNRPWQPQEKLSRPCQQLVLPVAGAGG